MAEERKTRICYYDTPAARSKRGVAHLDGRVNSSRRGVENARRPLKKGPKKRRKGSKQLKTEPTRDPRLEEEEDAVEQPFDEPVLLLLRREVRLDGPRPHSIIVTVVTRHCCETTAAPDAAARPSASSKNDRSLASTSHVTLLTLSLGREAMLHMRHIVATAPRRPACPSFLSRAIVAVQGGINPHAPRVASRLTSTSHLTDLPSASLWP